ncbi:MAG TPA: DinB family protein [Candidatus Limnocylindria bacterium]|nr:DinB family protein [Candidatus Limnocylindria bacterium]
MRSGIAPFYEGWRLVNDSLLKALSVLSADELALPVGSATWPVWASAAHLAGARVYWLCHVFGEAGAETTPFTDPTGFGWEDDLAHPRTADELVVALTSSWKIVERCLATWTPESLSQEARRTRGAVVQIHTRQSVVMRLVTHDAYHCGEISLTLGGHGLPAIDPWAGLSRIAR